MKDRDWRQENVSEWCWDRYGDYTNGAQTNPLGTTSDIILVRVVRGGDYASSSSSSASDSSVLRSVGRSFARPESYASFRGFRLVRP